MEMAYDGSAAAALKIKQAQLTMYLQAEQTLQSGAQSYKLNDGREITRIDMDKIHSIISRLIGEIAILSRGRSRGVIPIDD
jgi:hypothetical protein